MKNNLKILRKERKITQEQLAKSMGVTRQTIIAIEQDKYDPTLKLALALSEYFEMTVNEIFYTK
ncbi:transcriptional regulator [Macrococcus epidermidis]|uniref:Transcriptional regulator n=2 Tax=Macrococcus epidermidis TaxID=1902580 RepID=A0A327ZQX0_9STAP|nr:helix-turn-helix transcriptional regulator [Macrococcus epidermidis]RAK44619.1 transcriptional regulator [Macrococcus epidermidis]UTH16291.1 helix-turn-helix transcriptional regulator [Macrococcus epidermidis]